MYSADGYFCKQVIDNLITYCTSKGVSVILDPHNNDQGTAFSSACAETRCLALP